MLREKTQERGEGLMQKEDMFFMQDASVGRNDSGGRRHALKGI